jgi:hypothetical protein
MNVPVFWDVASVYEQTFRRYVPPKRRFTYGVHGAISKKIAYIRILFVEFEVLKAVVMKISIY